MSYMTDGAPLLYSANDNRGPLAQAIQDLANGSFIGTSLSIYVDAVNGNDSNAGTQASPLRTFQAAWAKLPSTWAGRMRIFLAAGTYDISDTTRGTSFYYGQAIGQTPSGTGGTPNSSALAPDALGGGGRSITIVGTYATQFTGTVTALTSQAGALTGITDTGQAWTANALEGMICRFTSGTANGRAFRIRENGVQTLEPLAVVPVLPTIGDTFVVQTAASIIQFGNSTLFCGSGQADNNWINFIGCSFQPKVSGNVLSFTNGGVCLNCCDMGSLSGTCTLSLGRTDFLLGGNVFTNTDLNTNLDNRVGFAATRCAISATMSSASNAGSYVLLRGAGATLNFVAFSYGILSGLDSKSAASPIQVQNGSVMIITPLTAGTFSGVRVGAATTAVTATRNTVVRFTSGVFDFSTCTGSAVIADINALIDASGTVTVGGSGNSVYGVSVQRFSRAIVNANVTVAGTSGELLAGATAGTYAGVNGGTALTEAKSQTAIIPTA